MNTKTTCAACDTEHDAGAPCPMCNAENATTGINYPPALATPAHTQGRHFLMQVPVISTTHLSQTDCDALEKDALFVSQPSDQFNFGFIIVMDADEPVAEQFKGFSPATIVLLKALKDLGYYYVRFDGDCGDVIPGLPTFNW